MVCSLLLPWTAQDLLKVALMRHALIDQLCQRGPVQLLEEEGFQAYSTRRLTGNSRKADRFQSSQTVPGGYIDYH